jgi:hypothetical protein
LVESLVSCLFVADLYISPYSSRLGAGVGKSSIAHTLAKRFEDIGRLGSSFCFSKDHTNRTPDLLIPTLARDLAGYDPLVR